MLNLQNQTSYAGAGALLCVLFPVINMCFTKIS